MQNLQADNERILKEARLEREAMLKEARELKDKMISDAKEEAQDQVVVDYTGDSLEVGFNVSYLQDVTNVLDTEDIKITLSDANSSALLEEPENSDSAYVVMPMRL